MSSDCVTPTYPNLFVAPPSALFLMRRKSDVNGFVQRRQRRHQDFGRAQREDCRPVRASARHNWHILMRSRDGGGRYSKCGFDQDASLATLQMLANIESRLEECVIPDFEPSFGFVCLLCIAVGTSAWSSRCRPPWWRKRRRRRRKSDGRC